MWRKSKIGLFLIALTLPIWLSGCVSKETCPPPPEPIIVERQHIPCRHQLADGITPAHTLEQVQRYKAAIDQCNCENDKGLCDGEK